MKFSPLGATRGVARPHSRRQIDYIFAFKIWSFATNKNVLCGQIRYHQIANVIGDLSCYQDLSTCRADDTLQIVCSPCALIGLGGLCFLHRPKKIWYHLVLKFACWQLHNKLRTTINLSSCKAHSYLVYRTDFARGSQCNLRMFCDSSCRSLRSRTPIISTDCIDLVRDRNAIRDRPFVPLVHFLALLTI